MIRSQLRQIVRHGERVPLGVLPATRHFSVSRVAAEGEGQGQGQPSGPNSSTQRATSTPAQKPRTFTRPPSNRPPGTGPPRRPRPAGAVDARSFAAPRAGDQPKIIRRPRLQVTGGGKPGMGKPVKKERGPRRPRAKRAEVEENDEVQAAAIKQVELDQIMEARPTPVRYEPGEVDYSTLQETWPSLPTNGHGRTAAVLEKLAIVGNRFPNGYVPPYELGRRYHQNKYVLFRNEAEKAEAMEEVNRISREEADHISQQQGELVEPHTFRFRRMRPAETETLVETFVQGKYPTAEVESSRPASLDAIVRNMRNNATYQTTGKRPQFLAKVENLLSSGRIKHA